jgi:hypothetical protein
MNRLHPRSLVDRRPLRCAPVWPSPILRLLHPRPLSIGRVPFHVGWLRQSLPPTPSHWHHPCWANPYPATTRSPARVWSWLWGMSLGNSGLPPPSTLLSLASFSTLYVGFAMLLFRLQFIGKKSYDMATSGPFAPLTKSINGCLLFFMTCFSDLWLLLPPSRSLFRRWSHVKF